MTGNPHKLIAVQVETITESGGAMHRLVRSDTFPFGFMLIMEDPQGWQTRMPDYTTPVSGQYNEMWAWCVEQFGAPATWGRAPSEGKWYATTDVFRFKNHSDAVAYKLRWC
ncbi:MAG: hypothetical protein EOP83_25225 [Verrucomicrobiaceae bacterium]|nr:MAG: hypothetical protein EOP83_25225 [Verrucomicrobiaceae bacterium]